MVNSFGGIGVGVLVGGTVGVGEGIGVGDGAATLGTDVETAGPGDEQAAIRTVSIKRRTAMRWCFIPPPQYARPKTARSMAAFPQWMHFPLPDS